MGNKSRVMLSIICLVVLLAIPAIGACTAKEKALSDLAIKVDWVEPVAMAVKPANPPASLAQEYSTFHLIMKVSNPNDFLVTVESMEPQLIVNDIVMGVYPTDGPIYIPPGKEVRVRFPITLNSRIMMLEVLVLKQKNVADATNIIVQTWEAIQKGTAKYQIQGVARLTAGTQNRTQNFDIRWP